MKQLSVVVRRDHARLVHEAFALAAIVPIGTRGTVAGGLGPAPQLKYRGTSYDDDRCVRIDAVVTDAQADEVAVSVRQLCGPQGYLLWSFPVDGLNQVAPAAAGAAAVR